ncbi:MAG: HAD-IA family hydrolase [Thiobacillus sp.]|nr:HAD-IA family hydrolase [Thiobacillus sp.]
MTLHALLFDVDGTLADTERDGHRPAFNQAFADAGLDWHWDVALYGKLALAARGEIPMRPGVGRLLAEARAAGLRLAIATTTTPENVTALLEHSLDPDSPGWFEVIAAGDIVPDKKPAPDIYHYALEKMGLDPIDCLAFEDSQNGLRASLGADLKTLVTVNDYTLDHDFTGAAVVLSDLGEPGAPNRIVAGPDFGQPFVDVAYLRALHRG